MSVLVQFRKIEVSQQLLIEKASQWTNEFHEE